MTKAPQYGKDYGNKDLWDDYEKHWAEILGEINKVLQSNKKFAAHLEKIKAEKKTEDDRST